MPRQHLPDIVFRHNEPSLLQVAPQLLGANARTDTRADRSTALAFSPGRLLVHGLAHSRTSTAVGTLGGKQAVALLLLHGRIGFAALSAARVTHILLAVSRIYSVTAPVGGVANRRWHRHNVTLIL